MFTTALPIRDRCGNNQNSIDQRNGQKRVSYAPSGTVFSPEKAGNPPICDNVNSFVLGVATDFGWAKMETPRQLVLTQSKLEL